MAPLNSESRRNKESRTAQIGNLKPQENHHQHTAFLQNLILAQIKSPRLIKRFRILHGRLSCFQKHEPLASRAGLKAKQKNEAGAERADLYILAGDKPVVALEANGR
jgi:hypothetical protein